MKFQVFQEPASKYEYVLFLSTEQAVLFCRGWRPHSLVRNVLS